MSHVILLRQRIKAVETIRKTTHAMRLTSMSSHAQLQKKINALVEYRTAIEQLLTTVHQYKTTASTHEQTKHLHVAVGSQKGLCGAFNTRLSRFFIDQYHKNAISDYARVIAIGKKMAELLTPSMPLLYSFTMFSPANFFTVSKELFQHITGPESYTHVTIYSNHPHSFFIQKAVSYTLPVPRITTAADYKTTEPMNLECDAPIEQIATTLEQLHLKIAIEEILFSSLIAEQASRFISMDASTNNADKVLETMRRDYNKLRQATITRELTDLAGGAAQ